MTAGRLFSVLLHHKLLVLGLTLVVTGAVTAMELTAAPRYRAGALMQVQAPIDGSGTVSLQSTLSARERAVTITALGNTWDVAHRARAKLDGGAGIDCSFSQVGQSEYLGATCTGATAQAVSQGANAFAAALRAVLTQQREAHFAELRAQYREQVASLRAAGVPATDFPAPPAYPTANELVVIDPARIPAAPFAPQPKRAIALALILGLLVNSGIALVLDRIQNRARTPEELRAALGQPVLAAVPKLRRGARA